MSKFTATPRVVVCSEQTSIGSDRTDEQRMYHTSIRLSNCHGPKVFSPPWRETSAEAAEKADLGAEGTSLVCQLLQLNGVARVIISHYEVKVVLGRAFTWEEMEPTILQILLSYFPSPQKVSIQKDRATLHQSEPWAREAANAAYRRRVVEPFVAHSKRTDIRV